MRALYIFFYEMILIHLPVFFIDKVIPFIKIVLIHSKLNQDIFRLPLFFISILIGHADGFHHIAAMRITHIMRSGDVTKALFFELGKHGTTGFTHDSLTPIGF